MSWKSGPNSVRIRRFAGVVWHRCLLVSTHSTETTGAETGPAPQTDPVEQGEVLYDGVPESEAHPPGFFERNSGALVAAAVAVVVAVVAIAALAMYRSNLDGQNADTEAAFIADVRQQGATVDTVECDGDTCAAIISGQAFTVLVQEDEDGEQHFGVAAFSGD